MKITKLELIKAPRGHQAHASGTGTHKDKRMKRNRTRGDQRRKAIENDA